MLSIKLCRDPCTFSYIFALLGFTFACLCFVSVTKMMTYTQILWVNIGGKQQVAYNGAVEAVYTITSKSHMYLCAERSLGAENSTHYTR